MRPPQHWHLSRRQPRRWALPLAAVGSLVLLGLFAVWCWPSGGGAGQPPPQVSGERVECAGGAACAPIDPPEATPVAGAPPVRGRAAAVVEASCGALVYGRNSDLRLPPASLTKIATALVAAEQADLSRVVDVRVNGSLLAASTGSTVMGLEPGMRLTLRDLLYGLLLPSGNDAAIAIADEVAGSAPAFVQLMNDKAAQLGLRNTHFVNPHGLDEPGLYTSAYDIALLGRALLEDPDLAQIVRAKRHQPGWDGPELWSGNELLDLYPGAIGVKIGYTERAGQTIVAAAWRGSRTLIVSVLASWDRYGDAIALLDWAFASTKPAC
jgi:D-alanyl-D-alanine carboxypeptidase (penicillin-binding protein 5/6)